MGRKRVSADKMVARINSAERALLFARLHEHAIARRDWSDKPACTGVLEGPETIRFLSSDPKVLDGFCLAAASVKGVVNSSLLQKKTEDEVLHDLPRDYTPKLLTAGK